MHCIDVLLIEDNPGDAALVQERLAEIAEPGYRVRWADSLASGLARLAEGGVDVLLLDLGLPDSQGLAALYEIRAAAPTVPIVVLSSANDEQLAVDAVRGGAQDYLVKDCSTSLLTRALRYAIERRRAEEALRESERRERAWRTELEAIMDAAPAAIFISQDPECSHMIGNRMAYDLARKLSGSNPSKSTLNDEDGPACRVMKNRVDVMPDKLPMQKAALTGRPFRNCEIDLTFEDSAPACVLGNAVPLFDGAGRPRGAVGVFIDITDRKRAEAAVQQSNRQLHRLSRDLLRTQDYERRRIARELHDSTSQLLAALKMNLSRLGNPGLDADRKREALSEATQLAEACSKEIRTVTYLLHPPLLEHAGLVSALRSYVEGFAQRTGIEVDIQIPPDFGRLPQELEGALFRIVQEGLANVHKHSGSETAVIRLDRRAREVRLVLQDRGRGLPEALNRADGFVHFGVGIMGMRERAEQLGGRLDLVSDDAGVTLTVTLSQVQFNEEHATFAG